MLTTHTHATALLLLCCCYSAFLSASAKTTITTLTKAGQIQNTLVNLFNLRSTVFFRFFHTLWSRLHITISISPLFFILLDFHLSLPPLFFCISLARFLFTLNLYYIAFILLRLSLALCCWLLAFRLHIIFTWLVCVCVCTEQSDADWKSRGRSVRRVILHLTFNMNTHK